MNTTYDVRVYKTDVYRGTRVCSHRVRWKAGTHEWRRAFRSAAQADVFRGELLAAARKGEAFSLATGEPVSWQRSQPGSGWYEFACAYVDMKWDIASAKYRRAIAQALASATVVMVANTRGKPDSRSLRRALINWGYNTKQRAAAPEDVANILAWLDGNTSQVKELADPALTRRLLTAATSRLDGTRAAATSVRRNRAVLLNALEYAVELKVLEENPLKHVKWRAPQIAHEVDRQVVVNPAQARALLAAVRVQQPSGPRLVAFFGVLYYSGLRPEEAVGLRRRDVELPALVWDEKARRYREPDDDWGELHLRTARPDAGRPRQPRRRTARGSTGRALAPRGARRPATAPCAASGCAVLYGLGPEGARCRASAAPSRPMLRPRPPPAGVPGAPAAAEGW